MRLDFFPFRSIPSFVYALMMRNPRLAVECNPDVHGLASTVIAFVVAARHLSLTHNTFKSTEDSGFTIIVNKSDLGRPEAAAICAFSHKRERILSSSSQQFKNRCHDRYMHVTLEVADAEDAVHNPTLFGLIPLSDDEFWADTEKAKAMFYDVTAWMTTKDVHILPIGNHRLLISLWFRWIQDACIHASMNSMHQ